MIELSEDFVKDILEMIIRLCCNNKPNDEDKEIIWSLYDKWKISYSSKK